MPEANLVEHLVKEWEQHFGDARQAPSGAQA
jgi:hypothetical protein